MMISDSVEYFTGKNIYGNKVSGRLKIYKDRYFIENEFGEFEVKIDSICRYGEKETILSKKLSSTKEIKQNSIKYPWKRRKRR